MFSKLFFFLILTSVPTGCAAVASASAAAAATGHAPATAAATGHASAAATTGHAPTAAAAAADDVSAAGCSGSVRRHGESFQRSRCDAKTPSDAIRYPKLW